MAFGLFVNGHICALLCFINEQVEQTLANTDTTTHRFAKRLQALRKERKLTQEQLAKKAKLDTSFISAMEQGTKTPSLTSLELLAKGLSIGISELLDFRDRDASDEEYHQEYSLIVGRLDNLNVKQLRKIRIVIDAVLD